MQLRLFLAMFRALRSGRLADAAALKAALMGASAYPDIADQLRHMNDPIPRLEPSALAAIGEMSSARWCQQHGSSRARPVSRPTYVAGTWRRDGGSGS